MEDLRVRAREALAGFPAAVLPLGAEQRRAAVGVVLGSLPDGSPGFLLTRRAAGLRRHAGQWALPGGRTDEGESAAETAVRELHEEVGLRLEPPAVLGTLDDYPTRSGYVITPVVLWAGGKLGTAAGAGDGTGDGEVARVYTVPVDDLLVEPRFVTIVESDRPVIQLPLLGYLIHAPTAAVLYQFAEVVLRGRPTRVAHLEQPVFAWR